MGTPTLSQIVTGGPTNDALKRSGVAELPRGALQSVAILICPAPFNRWTIFQSPGWKQDSVPVSQTRLMSNKLKLNIL